MCVLWGVCAVGSVCCGECLQSYCSWEVFSVCAVVWGVVTNRSNMNLNLLLQLEDLSKLFTSC